MEGVSQFGPEGLVGMDGREGSAWNLRRLSVPLTGWNDLEPVRPAPPAPPHSAGRELGGPAWSLHAQAFEGGGRRWVGSREWAGRAAGLWGPRALPGGSGSRRPPLRACRREAGPGGSHGPGLGSRVTLFLNWDN